MNLQQFKDDFASSKGFKDFAEMTIKTLVTNEDWIGYDNLINEMMKLFSHACIKEFDFTDIKTDRNYESDHINKRTTSKHNRCSRLTKWYYSISIS